VLGVFEGKGAGVFGAEAFLGRASSSSSSSKRLFLGAYLAFVGLDTGGASTWVDDFVLRGLLVEDPPILGNGLALTDVAVAKRGFLDGIFGTNSFGWACCWAYN
jgi:hypothetical protein